VSAARGRKGFRQIKGVGVTLIGKTFSITPVHSLAPSPNRRFLDFYGCADFFAILAGILGRAIF
jgi:hypothetical protein